MNQNNVVTAEAAAELAIILIGLALFLAFFRLVRGPTLPDRVVALDLIGVLAVGMIAANAVATNQPILIDPAAVLALVGFLGTVAFARYLERRASND